MIAPADAFSSSYARARVRFLEAAATAGMAIGSHNHPLPGRDGEALAMDVALDGDPASERLLIVSSACHGVEGYCGSGVQVDPRQMAGLLAVSAQHLAQRAVAPGGFDTAVKQAVGKHVLALRHRRLKTGQAMGLNVGADGSSVVLAGRPLRRQQELVKLGIGLVDGQRLAEILKVAVEVDVLVGDAADP